jgi:hypothetical protein
MCLFNLRVSSLINLMEKQFLINISTVHGKDDIIIWTSFVGTEEVASEFQCTIQLEDLSRKMVRGNCYVLLPSLLFTVYILCKRPLRMNVRCHNEYPCTLIPTFGISKAHTAGDKAAFSHAWYLNNFIKAPAGYRLDIPNSLIALYARIVGSRLSKRFHVYPNRTVIKVLKFREQRSNISHPN